MKEYPKELLDLVNIVLNGRRLWKNLPESTKRMLLETWELVEGAAGHDGPQLRSRQVVASIIAVGDRMRLMRAGDGEPK